MDSQLITRVRCPSPNRENHTTSIADEREDDPATDVALVGTDESALLYDPREDSARIRAGSTLDPVDHQ